MTGELLTAEATRGPLPSETDVLIIGGGLAGAALAYYLAAEGTEVVLVERSELNREASGTNAGSFHFQIAIHQLTERNAAGSHDRLLEDVRLLLEAARLWDALEAELGSTLGVHRTGGLMVAETEDELRILHEKQAIEAEAGLETEVLEDAELRQFAPYLAPDLLGATYCPMEGYANPFLVAPLYAQRALDRGAAIRTGVDVTGLEHGFVVRTTAGEIRARRVVAAAGAWTSELARMAGLDVPVRAVGLHVNVTEPRKKVLGPLVQHIGRRLTLKQASNGTFIIGGGWPSRPETRPSRYSTIWESAAGNAAVAIRVMPGLADVRLVRMWTGVWASTRDLQPVLGQSAAVPGFHFCLAPTGFTLGPLVARMLAANLTRDEPVPSAYAPDRKGLA